MTTTDDTKGSPGTSGSRDTNEPLPADALARDRDRAVQRAEAEKTLREIASRLAAMRDPREILQYTVDEACRLVHAEGARIDALDERLGGLRADYGEIVGGGFPPTRFAPGEVGRGQGVAGRAMATGRPAITGDYPNDPAFVRAPAQAAMAARTGLRSVASAPMMGEEGAIAALTVLSRIPDAFDDDDIAVIAALADHAAVAVANARLIEELGNSRAEVERRADSERALRQISAALVAIREPARLLQLVVDEASRLVGADGAILGLLDPERRFLSWSYHDGLGAAFDPAYVAGLTLDVGVGVTGRAVAENRAILVNRGLIDEFPRTPESLHFFHVSGFRAMIGVPIVSEDGPLGALEVYSRREDAFDEADVALLEALASQAAVGLTNARLIEELARSRQEGERRALAERALREIGSRLTTIRDPGDLLQQAVEAAVRLLRGDGALLDLIDPATGMIRWAYDAGIDDEEARSILRRLELPAGVGMFGRAVAERRVLATADYVADDRFRHASGADEFARRVGYRSFVAAPLISESGALGVLGVYSSVVDAFDAADIALLGAFADQATVAIMNSRLIDELARSREEIARRAEAERTLREITARITALRDPGEVLQQIVDESKRLLASDGAHLTLLSDDRSVLHPVVVAGGADAVASQAWLKSREFPVGRGLNGLAAAEKRPIWTFDYLVDPRIPHEPDDLDVAERLGLRGMAVAPLRAAEGSTIGTLAVSYREPRDFGDEELGLLQGLADQAAITVTNLRLYGRLADSESRYRFLVQASPDVVWAVDAERRFTYASSRMEELTGWRPDELVGEPWSTIVTPGDVETAQAQLTRLAQDPDLVLRLPLTLRHRDGTDVATEVSAVSARDDRGFSGAHGSIRDVRERERLLHELRGSEARFRYLIETSPDVIWQVDATGLFTYLSDQTEAVLGWRAADLLGRHFSEIVAPRSTADAAAAWGRILADPAGVQGARIHLRRLDGSEIATEIYSISSVEHGRFAGAHGSIRDITERDRLEQDLRHQAADLAASEERAHLARELHDSVTQGLFSMTLLTRSIEILLDRDPAAAAEKLGDLRELQRDALAETRALIFELRPSSLDQDGLVKALRTHAAAVQGRLGLPVVIEADDVERLPHDTEDALYRVAQEALHNVVKHANARQVRITLRRGRAGIRLTVEDDGIGFDAGAVPSGHLGLAGMRARAEKVGGTLAVASRRSGGTTIEVVVPDAAGPERAE